MKIPEYGHRVPIPTTRAPIRKQFVPKPPKPTRALIQFGQAVTEAGLAFATKYREALINDQLHEAELGVRKDINNFILELETDPEYEKYEDKYQTFKNSTYKRHAGTLTEREAQDRFKEWYDTIDVDLEFRVKTKAQQYGAAHMKVKLIDRINGYISMGGGQEAKNAIKDELDNAVAVGHMRRDEYETVLKDSYYAIDNVDAERGARGIMATEGIEAAKAWLYSKDAPKISLDDRQTIEKALEEDQKEIDALIKKQYEEQQKLLDNSCLDAYMSGNLRKKDLREGGRFYGVERVRREHYWNVLDQDEKEETVKSDDSYIDQILLKQIDPEISAEKLRDFIIEGRVQGKLTRKDFEKYLDEVPKHKPDIALKDSYSLTDDFYKEALKDKEPEERLGLLNDKVHMKKEIKEDKTKNEWDYNQTIDATKNRLNLPKSKEVKKHLEALEVEGRMIGLEERFPEERKKFYEKEEKILKKKIKRKLKLEEGDYTIEYNRITGEPGVMIDGVFYKIDKGDLYKYNKTTKAWEKVK